MYKTLCQVLQNMREILSVREYKIRIAKYDVTEQTLNIQFRNVLTSLISKHILFTVWNLVTKRIDLPEGLLYRSNSFLKDRIWKDAFAWQAGVCNWMLSQKDQEVWRKSSITIRDKSLCQ